MPAGGPEEESLAYGSLSEVGSSEKASVAEALFIS